MPSLLYQMTFHSEKYLEGQNGSFGLQHLALLPVALLASTGEGAVALALGLAASLGILPVQMYLRYLYPALPFFAVAMAAVLRYRPARWAAAAICVVNLFLLASSGWYHKELYFNLPFGKGALFRYRISAAPVRELIDYLNRLGGQQGVAILEGSEQAGLRRPVFTNSWHSYQWWVAMLETHSPEDLYNLARKYHIEFFIVPREDTGVTYTLAHTRAFLRDYTIPFRNAGTYYIAKLNEHAAKGRSAPPAPPGTYDDPDLHIEYRGVWIRGRDFPQAHGGTITYTKEKGAFVSMPFRGTSITLIYTTAENRGQAEVSLDGKPVDTIDQHGRTTAWQSRKTYSGLAEGDHRITIRAVDKFVDVDAFEVR
jgi:hypothetical protein